MNKGFSLVELIVVIAIMAILVGVAVPVYTNYIKEAEAAVDEQYVANLESAINTAAIDVASGLTDDDTGTNDNIVPTSVVITNGVVEATNDSDAANEFEEVLAKLITPEADGMKHTFTLTNGVVTKVESVNA